MRPNSGLILKLKTECLKNLCKLGLRPKFGLRTKSVLFYQVTIVLPLRGGAKIHLDHCGQPCWWRSSDDVTLNCIVIGRRQHVRTQSPSVVSVVFVDKFNFDTRRLTWRDFLETCTPKNSTCRVCSIRQNVPENCRCIPLSPRQVESSRRLLNRQVLGEVRVISNIEFFSTIYSTPGGQLMCLWSESLIWGGFEWCTSRVRCESRGYGRRQSRGTVYVEFVGALDVEIVGTVDVWVARCRLSR